VLLALTIGTVGCERVRQLDIGRDHAYELGSGEYRKLELGVARRTGKGNDNLQGRYSGQTFIVGGF
jgi:hypothetical protein